jgi:hypothetical protein
MGFMTLILTELSDAGVAMVTDSAISKLKNGKLITKDQTEWRKLLRVPSIMAGISYWGSIGLITTVPFDEWLERRIKKENYTDLRSFAEYLAKEMNEATGGKPAKQPLGIHVAGSQQWQDGSLRPSFYHVHNGHGHIERQHEIRDQNGYWVIAKTQLTPVWSPRELFKAHLDFAPDNSDSTALLGQLHEGYLTANGDYAPFSIMNQFVRGSLTLLNTVPGFSVPRPHDLGSRVAFLRAFMQFAIGIYESSSMPSIIGGKVLSLGIKSDRTYLRDT